MRLSRNNSWSRMDEVVSNAGSDPLAAVQENLAQYWALRQQKLLIAMISGINKDNAASNAGDYAHDIAGANGGSASATTRINTSAFIDLRQLLGDAKEFGSIFFVHSVVEAQLRKNNLVEDIPDSQEGGMIPTFQGARLVMLDGMPSGTAVVRNNGAAGVAGMYESWLFAPGAIRLGMIPRPTQPEYVEYYPDRGNGGGETVLHQRFEFLPNFPGHTYAGSRPAGGPSNAATANQLNHAGSWSRVYTERKMIPYARLVTRES